MKDIFQFKRSLLYVIFWIVPGIPGFALTTLHLGPSSGAQNTEINVPLEIRSDDNVTAIQFDVLYNSAEVNIGNVTAGNATTAHTVDYEIVADGVTRVVIVSNTNKVLTTGVLSSMAVNLLTDIPEGTRSISFSNVIFSDTSGTDVAIIWAPYVSITSPESGKRFSALTNIGLSAVAVSYDGSITSVEFFVDGESVTLDTNAPYTASWTATGSGEVILTAVAVASNLAETTSLEVPITIGPPPYQGWFAGNFTSEEQNNPNISGPAADPDIDLIPNLLEYALGLDPRNPDTMGLPEVGIAYVGAFGYASLTYRADPSVDDLIFTVEVSDDGITWNSGESYTEELRNELTGNKRVVEVRDLIPLEENVRNTRLIRLTVRLNEN